MAASLSAQAGRIETTFYWKIHNSGAAYSATVVVIEGGDVGRALEWRRIRSNIG
jgi:hypothetical protein